MKLCFENSNSESGQTPAVDLFWGNSQSVEAAGYFCRRAPSWMLGRTLNATLLNDLLKIEESLRRSFPSLGLHKAILASPLIPSSLDLHHTQKPQKQILDSSCVLISLSITRNKNITKSSTSLIRLTTRATNSRAVAHKSWMVRCSPCAPGF